MSKSYGINWDEVDEWRQMADPHYWESYFDGTYEKDNERLRRLARAAYLDEHPFNAIEHLEAKS